MALNDDALTTLDAARKYLGVDGETTAAEDDRIERIINGVSRSIRRRTGRQFVPKTPALDTDPEAAFDFNYDGTGYLSLAPRADLRSLSSITLDGSALAATQYLLEPAAKTLENTYTWLDELPKRAGVIRITGRWGAGAVPGDVELACLIEVDRRWENPAGDEQRAAGGFSSTDSDGSLSDEAWGLLEQFAVPTLG